MSINFKQFSILEEVVTKTDIVDAYVVMTIMSVLKDQWAGSFMEMIGNEIISRVKYNIQEEIESIILREFSHITNRCENVVSLKRFIYKDKPRSAILEYNKLVHVFNFSPIDVNVVMNLDRVAIYRFLTNRLTDIERIQTNVFGTRKRIDDEKSVYLRDTSERKIISLSEFNKIFRFNITLDNIIYAFSKLTWEHFYGGESWARIAQHVKNVLESETNEDFIKRFDRLIDFVHNTGSLISKFKEYKDGCLQFILDLKQEAINIRELLPYTSKEAQQMFRQAYKYPEWRNILKAMGSLGADESFGGYEIIVNKYIKKLSICYDRATPESEMDDFELSDEQDVYRYSLGLYQIYKKLGDNRFFSIVSKYRPLRDIIQAAVIIESMADKKTEFFSDYVINHYKIEYRRAYERIFPDAEWEDLAQDALNLKDEDLLP